MGERIKHESGIGVRYLDDVCHTLTRQAATFYDAAVRQLTRSDLELLESAPRQLRDACWESPAELLSQGIVACAIVSGEIVATALTSARSDRYAEVGVYTREAFRRRGLASAAASIVVNGVQEAGQIPVWSAGATNSASLRIAQKLGFREMSRRTYVILAERKYGRSA
jgi:RimJ/RimL family protein N-acetyltransferase